jgi:dihydroxyacid dehydratase/phosphogluconate dehydratase
MSRNPIPAVDARRQVLAHLAGRRIVEMVREDLTIEKILTREAFENAILANAAIGGSTNAVVGAHGPYISTGWQILYRHRDRFFK